MEAIAAEAMLPEELASQAGEMLLTEIASVRHAAANLWPAPPLHVTLTGFSLSFSLPFVTTIVVVQGGCVDAIHQSLVLLFMVLCTETISKVRLGTLSPYTYVRVHSFFPLHSLADSRRKILLSRRLAFNRCDI